MSLVSRSRANSDILPDNRSGWIFDAFHPYRIPSHLVNYCDDLADGHTYKYQTRFLGLSSLRTGPYCLPSVAFYEIAESESSDGYVSKTAHGNSGKAVSQAQANHEYGTVLPMPDNLQASHSDKSCSPVIAMSRNAKRHAGSDRKDIIFCLGNGDMSYMSPTRQYYLFPQDAVVEALNKDAPFEVLASFRLPRSNSLLSMQHQHTSNPEGPYTSKLDEFAAVCSSSSYQLFPKPRVFHRRLTDPGQTLPDLQPKSQVMNLQMSGVPAELFLSVKQTVSDFEATYQKMVELMRSHTEHIAFEQPETALGHETMARPPTKTEFKYEEECYKNRMISARKSEHRWSSSSSSSSGSSNEEVTWDKGTDDTAEDYATQKYPQPTTPPACATKANRASNTTNMHVKKCLYCGSKSTPMWRRGPQGAGTLCNACGVKWKHGKILSGSEGPDYYARESHQTTKDEKKRKRSGTLTIKPEKKSSKANKKQKLQDSNSAKHEEDRIGLRRPTNLNIADRARSHIKPAAPGLKDYRDQSLWDSNPSSSQSISDSFSPNESSPSSASSSPPLVMMGQVKPRNSIDMTMVEKIDISDAYTMSVGVDAVEAAAVLTLLKRS